MLRIARVRMPLHSCTNRLSVTGTALKAAAETLLRLPCGGSSASESLLSKERTPDYLKMQLAPLKSSLGTWKESMRLLRDTWLAEHWHRAERACGGPDWPAVLWL